MVEPQEIFVECLRQLVERAGLDIVALTPFVDLELVEREHPEAVVLDVDFLEVDIQESLTALREVAPEALVLLYTMRVCEVAVSSYRRAGASGTIFKDLGEREVVSALQAAAAGAAGESPATESSGA